MTALAAEPTPAVSHFLEQHRYLALGSHDPDGSIHLVPVVYLFTGGCFPVATSSSTRKARNVAAAPATGEAETSGPVPGRAWGRRSGWDRSADGGGSAAHGPKEDP